MARGRRGHDRMEVRFTTTYAISAYHHKSGEFELRSWQGFLDIKLCDKVCQWIAIGQWFSSGTSVSSTNKADRHIDNITEILLKVASNTINQPTNLLPLYCLSFINLRLLIGIFKLFFHRKTCYNKAHYRYILLSNDSMNTIVYKVFNLLTNLDRLLHSNQRTFLDKIFFP